VLCPDGVCIGVALSPLALGIDLKRTVAFKRGQGRLSDRALRRLRLTHQRHELPDYDALLTSKVQDRDVLLLEA
jgi:hypothetical protein